MLLNKSQLEKNLRDHAAAQGLTCKPQPPSTFIIFAGKTLTLATFELCLRGKQRTMPLDQRNQEITKSVKKFLSKFLIYLQDHGIVAEFEGRLQNGEIVNGWESQELKSTRISSIAGDQEIFNNVQFVTWDIQDPQPSAYITFRLPQSLAAAE